MALGTGDVWADALPASPADVPVLPRRLRWAGYLLCVLFFLLGQKLSFFDPLDLRLYDLQLRVIRAVHATPILNDVEIIGLDEASFNAFPEPFALWHQRFAQVFDALASVKPAVVGLDVVLPERSYEFIAPGYDRALIASLLSNSKRYPIVIAETRLQDGAVRPLYLPLIAAVGRANVGSAIVCSDPDGIHRAYDSSLCDGEMVPTLTSLMAAHLGRSPDQVKGGWAGRIDFRIGTPMRYTPIQAVIEAAESNDVKFLERFANKPVFIGATLPFDDRLLMPVPMADWELGNRRVPGVLLHAQILRSIMNYGFLQPISGSITVVLTILFCAAWFMTGATRPLIYWTLFAVLSTAGVYCVWLGWYLPAAGLLASLHGAYVARTLSDWLWRRYLLRVQQRALSRRLSEQQVAQLLQSGDQAEPMGRIVCILSGRFTLNLQTLPMVKGSSSGKIVLINRLQRMVEDAVRRHRGGLEILTDQGFRAVFSGRNEARTAHTAFEAAADIMRTLSRQCQALNLTDTWQLHLALSQGVVETALIGTPRVNAVRVLGSVVCENESLLQMATQKKIDLVMNAEMKRALESSRLDAYVTRDESMDAWVVSFPA